VQYDFAGLKTEGGIAFTEGRVCQQGRLRRTRSLVPRQRGTLLGLVQFVP
jgi:hypothetical protein